MGKPLGKKILLLLAVTHGVVVSGDRHDLLAVYSPRLLRQSFGSRCRRRPRSRCSPPLFLSPLNSFLVLYSWPNIPIGPGRSRLRGGCSSRTPYLQYTFFLRRRKGSTVPTQSPTASPRPRQCGPSLARRPASLLLALTCEVGVLLYTDSGGGSFPYHSSGVYAICRRHAPRSRFLAAPGPLSS